MTEAASTAGFARPADLPAPTSDLETALWCHFPGRYQGIWAAGEEIKRTVAAELGVPLVVITRPSVAYPQKTSDLSVALGSAIV